MAIEQGMRFLAARSFVGWAKRSVPTICSFPRGQRTYCPLLRNGPLALLRMRGMARRKAQTYGVRDPCGPRRAPSGAPHALKQRSGSVCYFAASPAPAPLSGFAGGRATAPPSSGSSWQGLVVVPGGAPLPPAPRPASRRLMIAPSVDEVGAVYARFGGRGLLRDSLPHSRHPGEGRDPGQPIVGWAKAHSAPRPPLSFRVGNESLPTPRRCCTGKPSGSDTGMTYFDTLFL